MLPVPLIPPCTQKVCLESTAAIGILSYVWLSLKRNSLSEPISSKNHSRCSFLHFRDYPSAEKYAQDLQFLTGKALKAPQFPAIPYPHSRQEKECFYS